MMKTKHSIIYMCIGIIMLIFVSVWLLMNEKEDDATKTVVYVNHPTASATIPAETVTVKSTAEETTEPAVPEEPLQYEEPLYLDINTSDESQLMRLDGIGEQLAVKIVAYRDNHGYFANIEEIMLVEGIGEGIFARICNNIYVENPVYTSCDEHLTEEITETEVSEVIVTEIVTTTPTVTIEDIAPIDLNAATKEELMLLPHVTEEIAESIIELRTKIHYFSHEYELLYVEELEQNQVAEIVEFVTVGQLT